LRCSGLKDGAGTDVLPNQPVSDWAKLPGRPENMTVVGEVTEENIIERRGVAYLMVSGKGDKIRYVELHPGTNALIHDYLEAAGHGEDDDGALFRPIRNNRTGHL
jgi:hypothetical protein